MACRVARDAICRRVGHEIECFWLLQACRRVSDARGPLEAIPVGHSVDALKGCDVRGGRGDDLTETFRIGPNCMT